MKSLQNMRIILFLLAITILAGCVSKDCRIENRTPKNEQQINTEVAELQKIQNLGDSKAMTRTKVYKPDGSLQCGQGTKISLETMQKDLKDITVYTKENKHDGLMRMQTCGKPTGQCNVYEIDSKDLEKAEKLGFKKWIR